MNLTFKCQMVLLSKKASSGCQRSSIWQRLKDCDISRRNRMITCCGRSIRNWAHYCTFIAPGSASIGQISSHLYPKYGTQWFFFRIAISFFLKVAQHTNNFLFQHLDLLLSHKCNLRNCIC